MELTDGYSLFFHCWPWMGLGAAITLTIIAFTTNLLRSNLSVSRWKDPTFIAWLGAIEYMFHNFEEYGVDFAGRTLEFTYMMNEMGLGAAVTEGAYLGCNIPFVWITGPVLAVLSRRYPALCGAMPIFALVNGLSHVAQLPNVGYNPGVATSIVLFIPLGIYTICTFYGKRKMFSWKTFWLTFGVAGRIHGMHSGLHRLSQCWHADGQRVAVHLHYALHLRCRFPLLACRSQRQSQ